MKHRLSHSCNLLYLVHAAIKNCMKISLRPLVNPRMKLREKTIAIVTAHGFEDSEMVYPYYRLKEAGANVIVCGTIEKGEILRGMKGVEFTVEHSVGSLDFDSIHAVVVPGGYAPDLFRSHERVQALLHHVHSRGGVVAAICHGPWALVSAGLLKEHQCTSYFTIRDDCVNAGGNWQDAPVVVDNRIITSRCPDDLPDFCLAVIEEVHKLNF